MLWSTSTVCKSRSCALIAAIGLCLSGLVLAQDIGLRAPSDAVAGNTASIGTTGSGTATFYLVGPTTSAKRDIQLGQDVSLSAKGLETAGRYIAIICSASCNSAGFFVAPSKPVSLIFLVHPSRAPVALNNAVSGVALTFDEFHNLVTTPATVQFQLESKASATMSHSAQTRDGIAWFRTNSGRSAGPLQISASVGDDVIAKRVVQQVASEPCNLRIKGQRTPKGIIIETEPVRDCSGNPVPDGTVVTFTAKSGNETSSVDAPVKQDVARAIMLASGPVTISAASGVAMGNELRIGGNE